MAAWGEWSSYNQHRKRKAKRKKKHRGQPVSPIVVTHHVIVCMWPKQKGRLCWVVVSLTTESVSAYLWSYWLLFWSSDSPLASGLGHKTMGRRPVIRTRKLNRFSPFFQGWTLWAWRRLGPEGCDLHTNKVDIFLTKVFSIISFIIKAMSRHIWPGIQDIFDHHQKGDVKIYLTRDPDGMQLTLE